MYQTTVGTRVVSFEPPEYVKLCQNGFFLPCDEEEAQAISANDNLYAISPDIPVPGHPDAPVAVVKQIPDGSYTLELLDTSHDHTVRLADLDEATCEQAVTTEDRFAQIEEALCELAVTMTEV